MELTIESAFSPGGIVGHSSYLLLVISMMMQRISLLRILVIGSALLAILYDWVWLKDPVGVFWESALVLVNVVQLLILYWKNLLARFSEDELLFINGKMPGLSRGKSRELLNKGSWIEATNGTELTRQGKPVENLIYISRGSVDIFANNKRVSQCSAGDFIGEMTIMNREAATATTVVNGNAHLWQINAADLNRIIAKHSEIKTELEASFSRNLREKIIQSNALVSQGVVP
jgi:hypothetical protein